MSIAWVQENKVIWFPPFLWCGWTKVNQTGGNRAGNCGNRSNQSGLVPVPAGLEPLGFKILNLNSKKRKNLKKNLKNTSRCVESNGVKNFQIFIHLVYFASIRSSTKKEKGEKIGQLNF
jgi:hypothetical protein